MREFKLLNLSIFYECDNELKLEKEQIIAQKTIFGNYKEIVTSIKFKPRYLNEDVFLKYYDHNSYEIPTPHDNLSNFIELEKSGEKTHNYYGRLIKKYGFAFVLNYENNDFNNLRIANPADASSYGENFDSTKFAELIKTYNDDTIRTNYYRQDKRKIINSIWSKKNAKNKNS